MNETTNKPTNGAAIKNRYDAYDLLQRRGTMSKSPREQVKKLILESRGKENGISSSEIAEALDIKDSEARPNTRGMVRRLISQEKIPIASHTHTGYFIPATEEECEEYLDSLRRRAGKIEGRREDFTAALEDSDHLDND